MMNSLLLELLVIFLTLIIFFLLFMGCLYYHLIYPTPPHPNPQLPAKSVSNSGLSPSQLQKLPSITGKDLLMGSECAICLDDIATDQPARLIPGCNHAFHVKCADTWLSKHPTCPLCRAKLDPMFFCSSKNPC